MSQDSLRQFLIIIITILWILQSFSDAHSQSKISFDEGTKKINGTELYYKKMGDGEPILVIHGGPVLDHGYLVPYFKPLKDDYELLYYDQRLSGRSSADVDSADITLDSFVEDIEGLRKEFGYEKIHLMAHSWGGLLALEYAIKYPGNLNSLILLNSMPASSELWQKENQMVAERVSEEDSLKRREIINSDLFKNDPPKAIEQLLILSFRNQFENPVLADSLKFYIPDDYMIRSQKFGYLMPELTDYDLHEELHSIDIATLLVYGESEPAVEISGRDLNQTIPNSRLTLIPSSGHFPFIEQQGTFIREIHSFLDAVK